MGFEPKKSGSRVQDPCKLLLYTPFLENGAKEHPKMYFKMEGQIVQADSWGFPHGEGVFVSGTDRLSNEPLEPCGVPVPPGGLDAGGPQLPAETRIRRLAREKHQHEEEPRC